MNKKITYMGLVSALALVLSYFERYFDIGIPGVKPGIANIAVLIVMYLFTTKEAFFILVIKIVFGAVFAGNISVLLYSALGGLLSFIVMSLVKKSGKFSIVSVSVAGGVMHNVGQLVAAGWIIRNINIYYFLPVLLIFGIIAGIFTGLIARGVIRSISR